MSKQHKNVKIVSYGIYSGFEAKARELPKIAYFCEEIPARLDIEFGMIVNIKQAKGKSIEWCIEHPHIPGDDGKVLPPFRGTMRVKSADWKFFLGDTIWAPPENKMGAWHMWVKLDGERVADKTFHVVAENWSHLIL
ncbi:MAG: DUF3859 domain-containing protein [Deltaproteobacteria bacterium]|nr:DUF3859 domain-containing protein [Deltaproteobacteria bacterium]